MSSSMEATFSTGSMMYWLIPSNNQLRISLDVDHRPSPCASFFKAIGSSPGWLVIDAGGNTLWMACSTALV